MTCDINSPLCRTVEDIVTRVELGPYRKELSEEQVRYVIQQTLIELGVMIKALAEDSPKDAVRYVAELVRRCKGRGIWNRTIRKGTDGVFDREFNPVVSGTDHGAKTAPFGSEQNLRD